MTRAIEDTVRKHTDYLIYQGKAGRRTHCYRETPAKREARINEGCLVVEMEAAALFAVAKFRGMKLGQIVYGGDLVIPDGWEHRNWYKRKDIREKLFWLAVEACV